MTTVSRPGIHSTPRGVSAQWLAVSARRRAGLHPVLNQARVMNHAGFPFFRSRDSRTPPAQHQGINPPSLELEGRFGYLRAIAGGAHHALAPRRRNHVKNVARITLALYSAALITPLVHDLWGEEERCTECEAMDRAGPRLEAGCDRPGPCEDPEHHHHKRHDHGQCPLCLKGHSAGLAVRVHRFENAPEAAGLGAPERSEVFARRLYRGHPLPRAPPSVS